MFKGISSSLFIAPVLVAFCIIGCSASTSPGHSSSVKSGSDPYANDVFVEINRYRSSLGKPPLMRHPGLDRLASAHSSYLLQHRGTFSLHGRNVSHYGFGARTLAARRIYGMDTVSENVAAGVVQGGSPGSQLLAMWKRSKDHHNNLLDAWTYTGIGLAKDTDNTVFCTQIFASPSIGYEQLRDRMNSRY